jgi:hypothetical protein
VLAQTRALRLMAEPTQSLANDACLLPGLGRLADA